MNAFCASCHRHYLDHANGRACPPPFSTVWAERPHGVHTAGPLRALRSKHGNDVGVVTANGEVVAECYAAIRSANENAAAEAMANALLFAAAEDLLAVAVRVLPILENVEASEGHYVDREDIAIVRAAIVKAAPGALT